MNRYSLRQWAGAVFILSGLSSVLAADDAPVANRLGRESSPYLLAHANNPVHWQPWGPAALARAKAENKLIFLSSGYHACHWCHVMERESFTNPKVAELLNAHFVCIKVDREERPDVDHVYLTALNAMGQNGGWPLSMFLTSDGKPIAGGTYWPPEDREVDGQTIPGFLTVLKTVIEFQLQAPDDIRRTAALRAEQTRRTLALDINLTKAAAPSRELVTAARETLLDRFDSEHGGFGRPPQFAGPKFPRPPYLMLLLDELQHAPSEELRRAIHKTLTAMAQGGIHDQLGSGFHRYSTERTWTVPHFEKMLYDNAQLLEVYAAAYRDTPEPLYRQVLEQTAEFLAREMTTADGVFTSSLDADTEHEEGRYYVWTAEELAAAVPDPEDLAFLHRQFGTDGPPNFEERRFILVRRTPLDTADAPRLQRLRITLLAARERRPRPNVDTKVLTSWNGLTIAGLASAGHALKDAMLIARAKRAAEFLLKTVKTDDGRLFHVYAAAPGEPAKPQVPGYLDDYTHLVHGLLALHDATGQERWLASAGELTDAMIARFHDEQSGGFFFTTADHDALFVRLKDQHDGVQLSGNGQAVLNLIQLWKKTGNERYRELANRSLNTFAGAMQSDPVGLTGMVRAIGLLDDRLK